MSTEPGDIWEALKEWSKEKKAKRHGQVFPALEKLQKSGLKFKQFSPEHFRVWKRKDSGAYFDYWPSTGRWRSHTGAREGFMIRPLIRACTEE